MTEGEDLLTTGLAEGYAGKTDVASVDRGGFTLKSSQYSDPNRGVYVDQWLPARTGGGQELAATPNESYTRLYAGGVVDSTDLEKLGVTEKDVIQYLIGKILELGPSTRLHVDCSPDPDGYWQYAYQVTDRIEAIELTRALETIHYKNTLVFAHGFEICRVRE